MAKILRVNDVEENVRDEIISHIRELNKDPERVVILKEEYVPMRLQHIFNELGKEGIAVISTLVINGELYLIGEKISSKDLQVAPDAVRKSSGS